MRTVFTETIPKTKTDKLDKKVLRDEFESEHGRYRSTSSEVAGNPSGFDFDLVSYLPTARYAGRNRPEITTWVGCPIEVIV